MFKKVLFAAAFAMACSPAFVSAQDFFFSFDEFSRQSTLTTTDPADGGPTTGQLFIFGDENLDFNQLDLDFTVDDASVATFTGGTAADSDGSFSAFSVEDPNVPGGPVLPTDGRLFGVSISLPALGVITDGQDPALSGTDAEFRPGANGFLLGTVDFAVNGPGTANFDFIPGALGVVNDDLSPGGTPINIDPDFIGSTGTLIVEANVVVEPTPDPEPTPTVPEPSSTILLILGAAGMVARRKRS